MGAKRAQLLQLQTARSRGMTSSCVFSLALSEMDIPGMNSAENHTDGGVWRLNTRDLNPGSHVPSSFARAA